MKGFGPFVIGAIFGFIVVPIAWKKLKPKVQGIEHQAGVGYY